MINYYFNKTKRNVFELLYFLHLHKKKHQSKIFFVSFPKAGRTWIRHVLEEYSKLTGTKFDLAFSHRAIDLKFHKGKKVILLNRDPKDVLVSYYFNEKFRTNSYIGNNISEFIRDKKFGVDFYLKFMEDLNKYKKYPSEIVSFNYEVLRKKQLDEFYRLFSNLDIEVSKKDLKKAIENSSFKKMQENEKNNKYGEGRLKTVDIKDNRTFKVRKGKIGGYKEELSENDIKFINNRLKKSNYSSLIKKLSFKY